MPQLTDTDRATVSQAVRHSKLVEASRTMARIVKHVDPDPRTKAARTRYEKSLTAWMKHHGGEAFDRPFSKDHERVIEKTEAAINDGGLFALAMPRGHGKSTILKWATLYCLLTGRRKYVVVVAATAELAQAIVDFARQQIQESDTLHAHYPHVTTYARATGGKAIKAKYQLRADGKTSGIQWSKNTLVLPEVLDPSGNPYTSNGAILEGHGLTGAIRGKWRDTKTGKVLRPDFVLCDDPQTRESAESESQCSMRERIITGDVLGLAGPRKRIAAVMPCTIVRKGDLAARFLDRKAHPEWQGETCSLVDRWPDAQESLWREYALLYKDEGRKPATEFYKGHREAMDKGAVVSWEHRVRDGELSAIQTAENLLIETGDQFWAEYQNDPHDALSDSPYTLTPELICSRTDRTLPPRKAPDWTQAIVATTDVNISYALSTVIVAFGANQRSHVLWYGTHPMRLKKDDAPAVISRTVQTELGAHGKMLASMTCRPTFWSIDGGGTPQDTVINFCGVSVRACGLQAYTMFGRDAKGYKPTGKHKMVVREQIHLVSENINRRWLIWNADYWREIAQLGWASAPGLPGACSLCAGSHREFAEQVAAERLAWKRDTPTGTRWEWKMAGKHDFGDCMAMAYASAAFGGIGTGGKVVRQRYVERRKPRVVVE